jgi:cysteine desulfuration protein SufE
MTDRGSCLRGNDEGTFIRTMYDSAEPLPPTVEKILARFRSLSREDRMQALLQYSKKLEPVPERFRELDRTGFAVPECMTPVALYPEYSGGRVHFYADVDVRRSPTVAAFLAILFAAVNDEPPSTVLAIPSDFVRTVMESIGLGSREVGLDALLLRVKRHANDMIHKG